MTMSIQKTQTGIDINAASTTQTIKAMSNSGFTERKQNSGLFNKLILLIVILLALIFLMLLAFFVKNIMDGHSEASYSPAQYAPVTRIA